MPQLTHSTTGNDSLLLTIVKAIVASSSHPSQFDSRDGGAAAAEGLLSSYDPAMVRQFHADGDSKQYRQPTITMQQANTSKQLAMVSQLMSGAGALAVYLCTGNVAVTTALVAVDQLSIPLSSALVLVCKFLGNEGKSLLFAQPTSNDPTALDPKVFAQLGAKGKAKVLVEQLQAQTDRAKVKAEEATKRLQICLCGVVALCVIGVFFYLHRHPTTSHGSSSEGSVGGPSFTKLRL